jgi:hypothetical protein
MKKNFPSSRFLQVQHHHSPGVLDEGRNLLERIPTALTLNAQPSRRRPMQRDDSQPLQRLHKRSPNASRGSPAFSLTPAESRQGRWECHCVPERWCEQRSGTKVGMVRFHMISNDRDFTDRMVSNKKEYLL